MSGRAFLGLGFNVFLELFPSILEVLEVTVTGGGGGEKDDGILRIEN